MTLNEILASFESRTDHFHEVEISDAIRKALKANELTADPKEDIYAEMDAFDFHEDAAEWDHGWGLYYGPGATFPKPGGGKVEVPALAAITNATIEHWKRRATESRHPLLRNRYADLVWELSHTVTGRRATADFPRIAIDAAIELSARDSVSQPTVFEKLERALRLALSLNDSDRVSRLVETLIAYESRRAEDAKPGTWGRAFALLLEDLELPLKHSDEAHLVGDLEARLARVAQKGPVFNPHAAERTALQLANYYRRQNRPDDSRRVLRMNADAHVELAQEASGLPASAWLEEVMRQYEAFGLKDEAAALQPALREAHLRASGELRETRHTVEVPPEETARLIEGITSGTLDDAVRRITTYFVVDRDVAERLVLDIARDAPIQALITRVILDDEGRPESQVGSIEEDLDGHVALHMTNTISFQQLWLRPAFQRLVDRHNPTLDQWCAIIFASPVFEPPQQDLVRRGVECFLHGDIIGAAHILVPQIEQAVRRLVILVGGSHLKPAKKHGLHYRLLHELLGDPAIERVLSKRTVRYLQVLLTDPRGFNLRNIIAHGYMPAERFTAIVADRLMHAVLVLALVRKQAPPDGS